VGGSQRQSADRFRLLIDVHTHEPETIYVVPIKSDSEHFPLEGKLRVFRAARVATNGALDQGPAPKGLLRERVARRHGGRLGSIPAAVYFGTTGGQVYASTDAGDSWNAIVRDLPAVVSVEVQTLP